MTVPIMTVDCSFQGPIKGAVDGRLGLQIGNCMLFTLSISVLGDNWKYEPQFIFQSVPLLHTYITILQLLFFTAFTFDFDCHINIDELATIHYILYIILYYVVAKCRSIIMYHIIIIIYINRLHNQTKDSNSRWPRRPY